MSKDNFILKMWERSPIMTLLVACGIGFGIYQVNKKLFQNRPPKPKRLPKNEGIPEGWEALPLATELYNALKGTFTLPITKREKYSKLISLTDAQLTAVYNEFNNQYFNEGSGTLTAWINDEWSKPSNSEELLNRMMLLGLP